MRIVKITGLSIVLFLTFIVNPLFSAEVILDETDIKGPSGQTYQVVKKEVDGLPVLEFVAPDGTVYTKEEFNALMIATTPVLSEELRSRILRMDPTEFIKVTIYMRSQPHISKLEEIRSEFEPQLKELESEIRQIKRDSMGDRPSMDEAAEKEYQSSEKYTSKEVSFEESERLISLKEEIEWVKEDMRLRMLEASENVLADAQAETRSLIEGFGGTVLHVVGGFNIVEAQVPIGQLEALAKEPTVLAIEEVRIAKPRILDEPTDPFPNGRLDTSTDSIGADVWWTDGIDGSNAYDFGVLDTGVQQNHPDLNHWYETNTGSSVDTANSGHGTHVTGIATSTDGTYAGVVPDPDEVIWSYSSGSEATAMTNMHWLEAGAVDSPEGVNWSFGWDSGGSSDYWQIEQFLDAFIQYYGTPVSIAATNATGLYHPEMAYNVISVLNMNDQGTLTRSDDLDGGSAYGPTPNYRNKPDLIAPGTNIKSTNNSHAGTGSGNPDPNCWQTMAQRQGYDWSRCSGTSMAAPHVGGSFVLFADAGIANPQASKAVLINTADAYDNNGTNNNTSDDIAVSGSRWDPDYGWGYIDLSEAHFNRADYFCDYTDSTHRIRMYRGTMYSGEKATLVWYKRGVYNNAAYPTTVHNLTDMDLSLYDASDGSYVDSSTSINENVEQVAADAYYDAILRVYQWSSTIAGDTKEKFCLATEENFERYYGTDTIGLYDSSSAWVHLRNSNSTGVADISFFYGPGANNWIAVAGDWDGDGDATIGLYDQATAMFHLRNSNSTGVADISFYFGPGGTNWKPIVGDWDGDGIDTIGLYDASSAWVHLRNSNTTGGADNSFFYGPGANPWVPVAGDWNGDGYDTIGLYDQSTAMFHLRNSNSTGVAHVTFYYGPGGTNWKPIAGDWDGDGDDTIGLYDSSSAWVHLRNSNSTGSADISFFYGPGANNWTPIAGDWNNF
jgi:hypothetical protein